MRILFVTTSYPRNPADSAGIFVARLVRTLKERGHSLKVIAPGDPNAPDENREDGVRVLRVPYAWPRRRMKLAYGSGGIPERLRRTPSAILQAPGLAAAMARAVVREARGADVIHAQWSFAGAIGRVAAEVSGVPLVLTTRGNFEMNASGVFGRARDWAIRGAQAVVTVNEKFADALRARGVPSRRIHAISNGVAPRPGRAARRAAARESLGMRADETALVNVGNLAPAKGVDLFIPAMATLGTPARHGLYVIGGGERRADLARAAAAVGCADRIHWVGPVAPERVDDWLDAADLFVFPSLGEGRPNAVLEAMASELPILASDLPEVRELIDPGRTGRLFRTGDAGHLAAGLRDFLANPREWDALGMAAREDLERRDLTWSACASRYESVYEEVGRR
ncbi:MAG: glycosyltransferase family 4 protein [Myxococcales bacterium]|nr:glycosyltransferase family 4 protein [Myxococcales bacterium]